ncbi:hypothetical protein HBA_0219 [Sodalis endosymbiont of Henestaris halophilus]|nr:hypothetical protein HBA_0219 [Sodalis endosymbiont of Henestaris halophilus]
MRILAQLYQVMDAISYKLFNTLSDKTLFTIILHAV